MEMGNRDRKYRPSNGTEGMWFHEKFCCECANDEKAGKNCNILMRTLAFEINEPEYPSEWTYDENGEPTCTAYRYYDPRPVPSGSRDYLDKRQMQLFEL